MKCFFLLLASVFVVTGCKNSQQGVEPVPYRNWESSSVKSNQIRIHYWRTGGTGKPVMIMAHGITDYGLVFASLAGKLEDDYDVIIGKALANEDKIYPKISAPVLILKADADEQTRQKHIKAASDLANGTIVHIDDATHQVRLDQPDETEQEIRRFLAGLN